MCARTDSRRDCLSRERSECSSGVRQERMSRARAASPMTGEEKLGKLAGGRQGVRSNPPEQAGIGIEDPVCPARCGRGESRMDLAGVYKAYVAADGDMGGAFAACCLYALLDDAYGEGIVGVPGKGMPDEGGMEKFKAAEVCRTLKSDEIGIARCFLRVNPYIAPLNASSEGFVWKVRAPCV